MGGIGSGRRYYFNKKTPTESEKKIDIRWLKKHGLLKPNHTGSLHWSINGRPDGYIDYLMKSDCMVLMYKQRFNGGEWQPVDQTVFFDKTPCNYGGHRFWFLCPGCGRRVAIIYGAGKFFLCRHCYGLTYASQQEHKWDRLIRRARKIRRRLGADEGLQDLIIRPKGMHVTTFNRLFRDAVKYEKRGWLGMAKQLGLSGNLEI